MSQLQKSQKTGPRVEWAALREAGAISVPGPDGALDLVFGGTVTFLDQPRLRAERVEVTIGLRGAPGMSGRDVRPGVSAVTVEGVAQDMSLARWWRDFPARDVELAAVRILTRRVAADGAVIVESLLAVDDSGTSVRRLLDDRTKERRPRVDYAEVLDLVARAEKLGDRPARYVAKRSGISEALARKRIERARRHARGA